MAQRNKFDPFHVTQLVIKMINGELTVVEQAELNEWLSTNPKNNALLEKLLDKNLWSKEIADMNAYDTETALHQMLQRINYEHKDDRPRSKLWPYLSKMGAAAALLIAIGAIFYFLNPKTADPQKLQARQEVKSPKKSSQIMLTLSDGSQVNLESVSKGTSIRQGSAVVTEKNKTLTYRVAPGASNKVSSIAYNTLTVPMGKKYQVTLPDGTEVWLNSNSSLKYPVTFEAKERLVELSGEGYFQVAHQAKQPFKVKSKDQVVEVLGTHFNIEAYPEDKKTSTTLVQGSVQVAKTNSLAKIKPGQTAVNLPAQQLRIEPANISEALAWKDGLFSFSDDRIEDIMRKVGRRYNVEVEFQGDVKDKRFWGVFPQDKGLENLLKNLEQTNTIHFKVDGRRIIVMP